MSQNIILALQSFLLFLQMVNLGIATVTRDPVVSLLIGAGVNGFQYYVTHLANQSTSPVVNAVLTSEQKSKIAEARNPGVVFTTVPDAGEQSRQ